MYPYGKKEDIVNALPGRSVHSIREKSRKVEIRSVALRAHVLHSTSLFSTWSKESAWLFGVLFPKSTFGVPPTRQLLFWSTRKSLVEQVATALEIPRDIGHRPTDRKTQYFITIASRELIRKLEQKGLVPLKKNRKLPDVPNEYIWHFLRGFFDTQSSIFISSHRWGVGFARRDVVEKINDVFYRLAGIKNLRTKEPCKIFYSERGHQWYFRIGGINLERLYKFLYGDISNIAFNKDKKEQFDKLLKIARRHFSSYIVH